MPADPTPSDPDLARAWEEEAEHWVRWARAPGHDSYWQFHRDRFLSLLPDPPQTVLDMGCGEGRLTRDLKARGYEVSAVDASPTLIRYARDADPDGRYELATATALPFPAAAFDLVVAFMSLHDIDAMPDAVAEAGRVLRSSGRLCAAVVHPIGSSGRFESDAPDAVFRLLWPYFERRRYADAVERAGLSMTFHSRHRTLEDYSIAFADAGLVLELIREVTDEGHPRWQRVPLFLHLRGRRAGG